MNDRNVTVQEKATIIFIKIALTDKTVIILSISLPAQQCTELIVKKYSKYTNINIQILPKNRMKINKISG